MHNTDNLGAIYSKSAAICFANSLVGDMTITLGSLPNFLVKLTDKIKKFAL
jgi:hypothetical protein